MALNPSSPITGAAVTGLTSPTYIVTEDTAAPNVRRLVCTGLGGTQPSVEIHSIGSQFFIEFTRPLQLRSLPRPNPVTGMFNSIPVNEFRVKTHKGATIVGSIAGATAEVPITIETKIRVPAGVELTGNDPEELKAALSMHAGALWANASGLYDLCSTGMLR